MTNYKKLMLSCGLSELGIVMFCFSVIVLAKIEMAPNKVEFTTQNPWISPLLISCLALGLVLAVYFGFAVKNIGKEMLKNGKN